MNAQFERILRPLRQAVRLVVGRGVLLLVNDALKLQGLQVSLLAGEVREDVERFQDYGFTSHPHPGAEVAAVSVAGNRDHVLVLAVDDRRYRLQGLQQGEVAIYTDEGDRVLLKRGGIVEVQAATRVDLLAPLVHCSGNLQVDGNVHADGNVVADGDVADQGGAKTMAGMRAAYNPHTHGASPGPSAAM